MLDLLSCGSKRLSFRIPRTGVRFADQIGRLPWSADSVNDAYKKAASAAGIADVSTHSMRHTYRSWLDAVGTPIAVQQKLMRHADIRTTMNTYGDVVTDEMAVACGKVARLALHGTETARNTR
jgi:integrase